MTFYGYDACGDRRLGELYRAAILDKFDHCPFTDEAKRGFHSWASKTTQQSTDMLQSYVAEHGTLPDRPNGMRESCQEHRNTAAYEKAQRLLERYARGEMSADAFLTDPCDSKMGAP